MFKNRRLFKNYISNIKEHKYIIREAIEELKVLPIQVVRAIGKEIIFSDYDGYNYASKNNEMCYFDNLNRWQKEFYIEQRLYKLYV